MTNEKKFINAGSLKPGSYVLIDEEVCQVKSTEKSKPGKHGSAKVRVVAFNIFTGQKRGILKGVDSDVEQPILGKKSGQVVAIVGDTVQVMDVETYETKDAPKPEFALKSGDEVEYQQWGNNVKINRKK